MTNDLGTVYLVGAGPGDVGLLTLRGAELLERAQAVVYDRLVAPEILALAAAAAERIYVGKAPGRQAMSQEEINHLLVRLARQGRLVVRLKGGDPFVFGRGGEEALTLREAGIPLEIVPGVTAGIAGPAYAGIPVTHRGLASAVVMVTGHEQPGKAESDLDYQALARIGTIVLYMGVGRLDEIARGLIAAGRSADTPAAVVERATTSRQRTVRADLAHLAETAARQGIGAPAIVIVGQVASLADRLAWCERRPLFGKTIVVTRTRAQASDLTAQLRNLGARVVECPTIAIEPAGDDRLRAAMDRLATYQWLVLTSANGVERFCRCLADVGGDARRLAGLKIAAIGPGTAERLADFGLRADLVPPEAIGESLAEALLAAGVGSGVRILLARAAEARDVLPEALRHAGAEVDEIGIYRTVLPEVVDEGALAAMVDGEVDLVTLTSSSTARHLVRLLQERCGPDSLDYVRRSVGFAAIGPITASTARELGLRVVMESRVHTIKGLVEGIVRWAAGTVAGEESPAATIRPATADDIPAVQQVIAEGLRGCGYDVSAELDTDFRDPVEFYRRGGGEFLVLDLPGAGVVGTVAVLVDGQGQCTLRRMYLDEPLRGRGYGRRLLAAAMGWAAAHGFGRMELETAPSMLAARQLYESAGFRRLGETRRFGRCGISYGRDL